MLSLLIPATTIRVFAMLLGALRSEWMTVVGTLCAEPGESDPALAAADHTARSATIEGVDPMPANAIAITDPLLSGCCIHAAYAARLPNPLGD